MSASTQVATFWCRRAALLHGGADDRDAEAAEQLLQVVAVLVLVALRQHDQPAAAAHERLDEVQLVRREPGRPGAGDALGAPLGRVRDHQHVAGTQHVAGERAVGVRVHVEARAGAAPAAARA